MKYLPFLAIIICAHGCTLFKKETEEDAIFRISEKVLDHKEGIDIIVQPIPMTKK